MGAQWKREKVQDHKFDFINIEDFVDNSCWRQFRYMLVFLAIIRGILVYCSDIFTAVNLLSTGSNSNSFIKKEGLEVATFKLPLQTYKYLFTACIVLSFLLLALEIRRARGIVQSRDISYAFTSQIASRYYTVRSYPHYCLFSEINNSKKTVDEVAFFCFFTFRNWKRLILADMPRQVINATILYQVYQGHVGSLESFFDWKTIVGGTPEERIRNNVSEDAIIMKMISLGAIIFTVTMCVLSLIMLIIAVILYIPLVSHIQGNLKEFCCHKIDKRIEELIRKNTKNRVNAAQSKGSKNKDIAMKNLQQPTLPQVDLHDPAPLPATTPRNVYNMPSSNTNYYQQQKDYGMNQQAYPSPQQPGYTANYTSDDYFQAMPPSTTQQQQQQQKEKFDPYADSAFTTDDAYDAYSSKQDQQYLQQSSKKDMYDGYYNGNSAQSAPSSRTRRYDDYGYQRTASPSQHGSDLESNINGSNGQYGSNNYGGYGGGGRQGYNGRQGYGNDYDYYPSSGQNASSNDMYSPQMSSQPQRPRRQDTIMSRNRGDGGY